MPAQSLKLTIGLSVAFLLASDAVAQVSEQTLASISTPEKVETRLGTLTFEDGTPSAETAPFARAFRYWSGTTASDWRDRQSRL